MDTPFRSIRLWDTQTGNQLRTFGPSGWIAFLPDGKTLVSVGGDIRLWDTETGEERLRVPKHTLGTGPAALSGDGKTLASVSALAIDVWDVETTVAPPDDAGE